jgi:hypothetical protein
MFHRRIEQAGRQCARLFFHAGEGLENLILTQSPSNPTSLKIKQVRIGGPLPDLRRRPSSGFAGTTSWPGSQQERCAEGKHGTASLLLENATDEYLA